jgi:hypothetical protein
VLRTTGKREFATSAAKVARFTCEHPFVAPKGTAHARFARAIEGGNLVLAETSAREMGRLALGDALALTGLYARAREARRFEPAAVRWHGRFTTELGPSINDAALALTALMALPTSSAEAGAYTLLELTRRYRIVGAEAGLRAFIDAARRRPHRSA